MDDLILRLDDNTEAEDPGDLEDLLEEEFDDDDDDDDDLDEDEKDSDEEEEN